MSRYHPRVVAWRTPEDLLKVKSAFFPAPNAPDQRPMALAKVRAWTTRGRLPHAIEATAILTEVILHDIPGASQLNVRLAYSTAICRFVNGLLDPGQQSQFALSMHVLARNLNLPASFVEIRHAATHEALPSLPVLRTVAVRALNWLWENYWVSVGVASTTDSTAAGRERMQLSRARLALKRWRQLRRDNPLKELKRNDTSPDGREALAIIKECVAICKDEEGKEALVDAFLEEKALVPAGKKKAPLMNGAMLLWLPLLDSLDASANTFAVTLLTSMLGVFNYSDESPLGLLAKSTTDDGSASEFNEAVLTWLQHLTSSSPTPKTNFGHHSSSPVDYDELIKQCVLRPTEWGLRFLRHLLNEYPPIKKKYGEIVEMTATQVILPSTYLKQEPNKSAKKGGVDAKKRTIEDVEEEIKAFEARFEAMQRQRAEWEARLKHGGPTATEDNKLQVEEGNKVGRWKKWSGEWVPKPDVWLKDIENHFTNWVPQPSS